MILLRLQGGLGNQLFQIAAGTYIENVLGRPVVYELSAFGHAQARNLEVGELLASRRSLAMRPAIARYVFNHRNPLLVQEQVDDSPLTLLDSNWRILAGYFQDAAVCVSVASTLAADLERIMPRRARAFASVGIHVRLGDYYFNDTAAAYHGLCGPGYFCDAIDAVDRVIGEPLPLRIFTDSPELFDRVLRARLPRVCELSDAGSPWDVLSELSRCAAVVMSNSSLSWWAAFVATMLDKQDIPVVMPMPWFGAPSLADGRMAVQGWTVIKRAPLRSSGEWACS